MKVTGLETYFLSAPLPQTVRTSTHAISRVSEVIVKLTTDAGLVGIGEAHGPFLFQGAEGLRTVRDILQSITPLVVGGDPFDVERILQDLFALTYRSVRGIPALARQQRRQGEFQRCRVTRPRGLGGLRASSHPGSPRPQPDGVRRVRRASASRCSRHWPSCSSSAVPPPPTT